MNQPTIFLYTDFGSADLYIGQVKAVLQAEAPGIPVIDLLNDAPDFDIAANAHLIAALAQRLPPGSVTLAVVDPGVGSPRGAIAVEAAGRWFVGPDNGLLSVLAARAGGSRSYALGWMPEPASVSFHGRDLFAPAAARIARGAIEWKALAPKTALDVEFGDADLAQIIYVDHYGNAMTGLRAEGVDTRCPVHVADRTIHNARVFSDVQRGELFWYENSIGLIELAANQASAASVLGVVVGDRTVLAAR